MKLDKKFFINFCAVTVIFLLAFLINANFYKTEAICAIALAEEDGYGNSTVPTSGEYGECWSPSLNRAIDCTTGEPITGANPMGEPAADPSLIGNFTGDDEEGNRSGNLGSASIIQDLDELAGDTGMPDVFGGIGTVLDNVLIWLLGIFGVLALIAFVISGVMYLTSRGDQSQIDNAKNAMTWSIIGVVVGLSGVIVISTIEELMQ